MCGWGGSAVNGSQALLFSSKDLVNWRYVSQFYLNSRAPAAPVDAGQVRTMLVLLLVLLVPLPGFCSWCCSWCWCCSWWCCSC